MRKAYTIFTKTKWIIPCAATGFGNYEFEQGKICALPDTLTRIIRMIIL